LFSVDWRCFNGGLPLYLWRRRCFFIRIDTLFPCMPMSNTARMYFHFVCMSISNTTGAAFVTVDLWSNSSMPWTLHGNFCACVIHVPCMISRHCASSTSDSSPYHVSLVAAGTPLALSSSFGSQDSVPGACTASHAIVSRH